MKKTCILAIAVGLFGACAAQAQDSQASADAQSDHVWSNSHNWWTDHFQQGPGEKYTAAELSLDLSASYATAETKATDVFHHDSRSGTWGGNVGVNYFLLKYFGIGADMNMAANGGTFIDDAMVNVIGRLPIGNSGVAPYAFGGGGRGFDRATQWLADVGVGIEFRLNHYTGLFVDARYVWPEHTTDVGLFRAGLRFAL